MADVEPVVKQVIAEMLGVAESEVMPEKNLIDDLGADSLDAVEISLALEERLEISIPDDIASELETIQQIIDYCGKEVTRVKKDNG